MTDRQKALDVAITQIEKDFGKGSIMRLGESTINSSVAVIPTGSLTLDIALGIGGLPRGRVIAVSYTHLVPSCLWVLAASLRCKLV